MTYDQNCTLLFMPSTRYPCPILRLLEISEKVSKISNFMTIRSVGAELYHADGQTDMAKLIDVFRNFANAPKKSVCTT